MEGSRPMISRWYIWWAVRWFRKSGWRFTGPLPRGVRRLVIVAGPHTSTLDFRIAVAVTRLAGFKTTLLVNKKYFHWPYTVVFKTLGAMPKDPGNDTSWKFPVLENFRSKKRYSVVFTPDSPTDPARFNTEWLDVAMEAGVPIMLIGLDHKRKYVRLHSWFYPSGDRERDIHFVRSYIASVAGHVPMPGITEVP
ncbi:MAG: hypothetical protein JNM00_10225 [Flavobacteriales bacterium]|nr:hypothetical protein [Flavobacteriales bacterium]